MENESPVNNTKDRPVGRIRTSLKAFVGSSAASNFLLCLTNLLAKIIPPDRNQVVFGSMNGRWYGDNSRHLFEWILQNEIQLKPIWVTKNREVYNDLRASGKPVALAQSPKGFWLLLRAELGVYTNSLKDISLNPYLIPDRFRLIALRHGRSVKRVRFARIQHKLSGREAAERRRESQLISFAISTSDFISEIQEECLRIGSEKHLVTGYPRNDNLLNPSTGTPNRLKRYFGSINPKPSKIILYAPSWRHGREATRFFPFPDFDEGSLDNFLQANDCNLLLRPHANDLIGFPKQREWLEGLAAEHSRIFLATHAQFPDVNQLLPHIDILISDYSALYHDFLLLNRPIILIPYDFEEFDRLNGFLYDYIKLLPGPKADSFSKFLDHLIEAIETPEKHEPQRLILQSLIHEYVDTKSSERVAHVLKGLLNKGGANTFKIEEHQP